MNFFRSENSRRSPLFHLCPSEFICGFSELFGLGQLPRYPAMLQIPNELLEVGNARRPLVVKPLDRHILNAGVHGVAAFLETVIAGLP